MKLLRNTLLLSVFIPQHGNVHGQPCRNGNSTYNPENPPNPECFGPDQPGPYMVNFGKRDIYNGNPPDAPDACGISCRAPEQYNFGLLSCLRNAFEVGGEMPRKILTSPEDVDYVNLPKVVFSPSTTLVDNEFNLTEYNIARSGWGASHLPAAVLYAETTEDVEIGVNCARINGFKVSPRGRAHDYSGIANLGGSLVIDMQLNCKMQDFVADKSSTGEHILPGSRYVGKMKVPSGCTNAAFLAAVYDEFKEEAGMNVIGSCPSVGVTGFFLNGGYGDVTPYAGLGSDVIDEIEMVLYNGTTITASATENEEIFWASKGGSGGLGVITNFWARIVQNPSPTKRFTQLRLFWTPASDLENEEQLETQVDIVMKLQEFLSENPKGALFGGGHDFTPLAPPPDASESQNMQGVFLGSIDELLDVLAEADLLGADILATATDGILPSVAFSDGEEVCTGASCSSAQKYGDRFPPYGLFVAEYDNQAEAQAVQICYGYLSDPFTLPSSLLNVARSLDLCGDLNIPQENCFVPPFAPPPPFLNNFLNATLVDLNKCPTTTVTQAILDAAKEPQGFLNRQGANIVDRSTLDEFGVFYPAPNTLALGQGYTVQNGRGTGGLILPTLQRETFKKLLRDTKDKFTTFHLAHGAPLQVSPGSTGYPHRNAFWNTPSPPRSPDYINILLQDPAFNGEIDKLQIYGNYNPSLRIPNYENHVFVDKVEELSCIRTKYDPLGGFDSPRYPQRSRNFSTKQQKDSPCVGKKNDKKKPKKAKKGK